MRNNHVDIIAKLIGILDHSIKDREGLSLQKIPKEETINSLKALSNAL